MLVLAITTATEMARITNWKTDVKQNTNADMEEASHILTTAIESQFKHIIAPIQETRAILSTQNSGQKERQGCDKTWWVEARFQAMSVPKRRGRYLFNQSSNGSKNFWHDEQLQAYFCKFSETYIETYWNHGFLGFSCFLVWSYLCWKCQWALNWQVVPPCRLPPLWKCWSKMLRMCKQIVPPNVLTNVRNGKEVFHGFSVFACTSFRSLCTKLTSYEAMVPNSFLCSVVRACCTFL